MKAGFINKFLELDVFKDIQSTTAVDASGKFKINEFRKMDSDNTDPSNIMVSEEELEDMLRKRGLL